MGLSKFQDSWLTHPEYGKWIAKEPGDVFRARCIECKTSFDLRNMGESALKSHSRGTRHKDKMKRVSNMSLTGFLVPSRTSVSASSTSSSDHDSSCSPTSASTNTSNVSLPGKQLSLECTKVKPLTMQESTALNNQTLTAEVLWAFKCVESYYSYNSCTAISTLFQRMFCDSRIAEQFTCGESKCAYLTCFGIAPYCQSHLEAKIKKADSYVLLFDESLNKGKHVYYDNMCLIFQCFASLSWQF